MILHMYAVYDTAVKAWMPPMYFRNAGEALRMWSEVCADSQSKVGKHPEDFAIFELGEWCDQTCAFELEVSPKKLGSALEYVPSKIRDRE